MQKAFSQIADMAGGLFKSKRINRLETELISLKKELITAYSNNYHNYSHIYAHPFDGEKTPGEMGAAKDYWLMYDYLRVRSWQAYLESEIAQIIINKYVLWVVGSGLKLQPEPVKDILQSEGIKVPDNFQKMSEQRFNLWANSRYSDSCRMHSVNYLAGEAFKNAIVGGDVLIVLRVENGRTEMQVIDGSHVVSPFLEQKYFKEAEARGNRIEYGVEISSNNEHIAYYVYGVGNKIYRISRFGEKSGRLMAFMIYGNKYRIDNVRGLPLISAILETLKKLDRYKEATVGSAEERQKVAYSIEHNADSTGENPLLAKIKQSDNLSFGEAPESKSTDEYEAAATKVALTTQKQAMNMPIGATLKLLESKNELYFKDFYTTNIQLVCASVQIPYEVAMAMYNSNYSASRAAIKDWEHSMKTNREKFSYQFYQPFYNLWLDVEVLNGKIQADGFIKSLLDDNIMAVEAYRNARWLGANVPNIDPVKEVMAERLKLGDDTTPLTTYDKSSEQLGNHDFYQVMERIKKEKEIIKKTLGEAQVSDKTKEALYKSLSEQIVKEWQDN